MSRFTDGASAEFSTSDKYWPFNGTCSTQLRYGSSKGASLLSAAKPSSVDETSGAGSNNSDTGGGGGGDYEDVGSIDMMEVGLGCNSNSVGHLETTSTTTTSSTTTGSARPLLKIALYTTSKQHAAAAARTRLASALSDVFGDDEDSPPTVGNSNSNSGSNRHSSCSSCISSSSFDSNMATDGGYIDASPVKLDALMATEGLALPFSDSVSTTLNKFEYFKSAGMSFVDTDQYDLAIEQWRKGIECLSAIEDASKLPLSSSQPTSSLEETLHGLGVLNELCAQAYLQMDDLSNALKFASAATGYSPNWVEAFVTLGRIQRESGRVEESLNSYMRARYLQSRQSSPLKSFDSSMSVGGGGSDMLPDQPLSVSSEEVEQEMAEIEELVLRFRELRAVHVKERHATGEVGQYES